MSVKLQGVKGVYHPKDSDEVRCDVHGVVTTWGALDPFQQLALESGLDSRADMRCLLAPSERKS